MGEILPLSVGLGLGIGLLITELFGVASGGLIVPGYIALYLTSPGDLVLTLIAAFLSFGVVWVLDSVFIVFGRRRTAIMILVGYITGMLLHQWSGSIPGDYSTIGFVIPGLIAVWMDRQGIVETLSALVIVSVVVRLLLVLFVGMELQI